MIIISHFLLLLLLIIIITAVVRCDTPPSSAPLPVSLFITKKYVSTFTFRVQHSLHSRVSLASFNIKNDLKNTV